MSDYIKRENAKRAVWGCARDTGIDEAPFEYAEGLLEDVPSEDVAPARHGRWKHERLPSTSGGTYAVVRCSVCECQYPMTETNYCPNCGAKMDEGGTDGTDDC